MRNLIRIREDNTVDLRTLFNKLEIKGRFRDWVKNTVMKYEFEKDIDYFVIETIVGKTVQLDYHVSLNMAKELCMIAKSPKGKQIRNYFIQAENAFHELNPKLSEQLYDLIEHNNDAKNFAMLSKKLDINEIVKMYIQAEKQNQIHNQYLSLLNTSQNNTVCITDICCKFKNLHPITVNSYLVKWGIIEQRYSGYYPSLEFINSDMAISASAVNPSNNKLENYVRYTPKGVEYIVQLLVDNGEVLNNGGI